MGHTATYDPKLRCIYVYGGSKNQRWFHDVHMLDLEEWKWSLLKVELLVRPQYYRFFAILIERMYIFFPSLI